MYAGNGGPTRQDSYFLSPFMPKTAEMALPVPTKTFLSRSPDTAMLFAPFECQPAVAEKRAMYAGNGGPTRQDSYFLSPFMPKTAEMALPVPTKTFLSRSPDTAMLFAPFECQPAVAEKRAMYAGNGGPTRQDSYFLSPFMPKTAEMALPVPTKTFLSRSPDTAMLFAPFECQPAVAEKRAMYAGNGGPTRQDSYFLSPFMPKTAEMALPVPTKTFLSRSPDTASLHPSGAPTHLPLPRPLCWRRAYLSRTLPDVTS